MEPATDFHIFPMFPHLSDHRGWCLIFPNSLHEVRPSCSPLKAQFRTIFYSPSPRAPKPLFFLTWPTATAFHSWLILPIPHFAAREVYLRWQSYSEILCSETFPHTVYKVLMAWPQPPLSSRSGDPGPQRCWAGPYCRDFTRFPRLTSSSQSFWAQVTCLFPNEVLPAPPWCPLSPLTLTAVRVSPYFLQIPGTQVDAYRKSWQCLPIVGGAET